MLLLTSSALVTSHPWASTEGAPAKVAGVQAGYPPQPTPAALWLRSLLTSSSSSGFGFSHELSLQQGERGLGGGGGEGGEGGGGGGGEKMLVLKSLLGRTLAEWARLALQVCPEAKRGLERLCHKQQSAGSDRKGRRRRRRRRREMNHRSQEANEPKRTFKRDL